MVQLGKYELFEELGRGESGIVYRARDTALNAVCAVKVLHHELLADKRFIERLSVEVRAASRLDHPHLVPVYSLAEEKGYIFLVMGYMPGGSLKDQLARQGRLPFERAVEISQQIAAAMDYVNNQSERLIHCEVKSGHVLFESDGNARLGGFGYTDAFAGIDGASFSTRGGTLATRTLTPPETSGKTPTRPACDVYSLACLFFEMITGQALSTGNNLAGGMTNNKNNQPLFPSEWSKGVRAGVKAVLGKALAQDRLEHYPSAGEFAAALTKLLERERGQGKSLPNWVFQFISGGVVVVILIVILMAGNSRGIMIGRVTPQPTRFTPPLSANTQVVPTRNLLPMITVVSPSQNYVPITVTETLHADILSTRIIDSKSVTMAFIPAGSFQMGFKQSGSNEGPIHTVTLDAFYIDIYEVTNARYKACVEAGACQPPSHNDSHTLTNYYGDLQYNNYPVLYVSWSDAQAYCQWRGARLPTEAEWEKAARGGLEGKTYPWGDENPTCTLGAQNGAQFKSCPPDDTVVVGSFAPNGYGLYDMAGNVLEWVADWYDPNYYASSPGLNPAGPSSGNLRVARGGCWGNEAQYLQVVSRLKASPDFSSNSVGFRCSR